MQRCKGAVGNPQATTGITYSSRGARPVPPPWRRCGLPRLQSQHMACVSKLFKKTLSYYSFLPTLDEKRKVGGNKFLKNRKTWMGFYALLFRPDEEINVGVIVS